MTGPPDEVAAVVARLRTVTAALRGEHSRWLVGAAERAAAREAAARRGDLGPGTRELQGRVDAGLTTWAAVLDGRDRSVAAHEARRHVEGRLVELAARSPADERGALGR